MAIDPVCGMEVTPPSKGGSATFEGRTFHFCSTHCHQKFDADPAHYAAHPHAPVGSHVRGIAPATTAGGEQGKAKDPICGMVVDKATALKSERAGRTYYFCSAGCQRTFENPETELKSMRTRVTIALTGVLLLAIMRAGAFIALAAGATLLTWAPIPALPWFSWGMWLFILVTPVQFIGGWGFYVGAWNAIRSRSINMDFLIALGTSVACFYSVVVLFSPRCCPSRSRSGMSISRCRPSSSPSCRWASTWRK